MRKRKVKPESLPQSEQDKALKKRVKELEAWLLQAEIKAEAYDEMIKIAEARYRIPIRKKLAPNSEGPARKGLRAIQRPGPVRAVWQEQAGVLPVRRGPGPGQGLPFPGRGHRGQGSGGRLLQQPPTAHEHRHDDSGRGLRDIRGQGLEMDVSFPVLG